MQEKLERLSTMETTHSIRFADVVVLVMDPRDAFEKQDVQIANLVIREGRGLVFAITKWDTVDAPSEARKEMEHQAEAHLPHAKGTPLVTVSGVTGAESRQADGRLPQGPQGLVGPRSRRAISTTGCTT